MKDFRYEIRFSGSGGQGMITAGKLMATAALKDGLFAVQSQSYGAATRGEPSRADVILSNREIIYPKAMKIDLLIVLSGEACQAFCTNLSDTILIVDDKMVKDIPQQVKWLIKFPIIDEAIKITGNIITANMFALGMVNAISNILSFNSVREAILEKVPEWIRDKDILAYEKGYEMGQKFNNKE